MVYYPEKKNLHFIFLSLEFGESEFLSLYEFGERECKLSLIFSSSEKERPMLLRNENDLS